MTKLLCIKASPRDSASRSGAVAESYLTALKTKHPNLVVDTIDLWAEKHPEFDGNRVTAKMSVITGQDHSPTQKTL